MRVYTKYHTMPARKKGESHFQWVLVAMLLAFLGWVWWKNLQHSTRSSAPEQTLRVTPVFRATRDGTSNGPSLVLARPATPEIRDNGAALRSPKSTYEVQVALARQGIGTGSLDGFLGSQTRAGLRAFQQMKGLPVTGNLDAATKACLMLSGPTETWYTVTPEDLARLSPVGATWLAKSVQDRLDYESILELVSEKAHAHPNLIRTLNPSVDWNRISAGTTLRIPDAEYPPVHCKASFVRIRLGEKSLEAFDRATNLLAHFPCSIARQVQKRPLGRLEVETIALNPNYKFSPEIFPESEEARQLKRPLMIPQGPNNPVGAAWIGLNRPGYGIHGTPHPEQVGRTESHGCFRLANWNAEYLAQLVEVGTPVLIEP